MKLLHCGQMQKFSFQFLWVFHWFISSSKIRTPYSVRYLFSPEVFTCWKMIWNETEVHPIVEIKFFNLIKTHLESWIFSFEKFYIKIISFCEFDFHFVGFSTYLVSSPFLSVSQMNEISFLRSREGFAISYPVVILLWVLSYVKIYCFIIILVKKQLNIEFLVTVTQTHSPEAHFWY